MRVLVTGAAGFTGTWMMKFLSAQEDITPIGFVRRPVPVDNSKQGSFIFADLMDKDSLHAAITGARLDTIIHLAGLTRGTPDALHAANVTMTKNLLDAASAANPTCRILVISSSAVYGYAGDLPIPETSPLRPVSDYGISKVAQEELTRDYYNKTGGTIAIVRPFNLAGPGQPDSFVCGRIVNQVMEIRTRKRDAIELQEIASSRDLLDVRDAIRGYWGLVSHPEFRRTCSGKVFNLGSGNSYRVSELIARIEKITGEHYTVRLPKISPSIPVPTQKSDNSRISGQTGWKPSIPIEKTLCDMLEAAGNHDKRKLPFRFGI